MKVGSDEYSDTIIDDPGYVTGSPELSFRCPHRTET